MIAPFGIGWVLLAVPPFAMLPVVDSVKGSLDLALLSFWISAFSAFYILALLSGYLGGWPGGRLRVSSGGDTAEPDGPHRRAGKKVWATNLEERRFLEYEH